MCEQWKWKWNRSHCHFTPLLTESTGDSLYCSFALSPFGSLGGIGSIVQIVQTNLYTIICDSFLNACPISTSSKCNFICELYIQCMLAMVIGSIRSSWRFPCWLVRKSKQRKRKYHKVWPNNWFDMCNVFFFSVGEMGPNVTQDRNKGQK